MSPHPSLPGRLAAADTLADRPAQWPVVGRDSIYESPYVSLHLDTISDPTGQDHQRTVVHPNGAVGVLALDDDDRMLLVEQFRHPVQHRLLELPAGTLDVQGEGPLQAAQRELAEEADVRAEHWESLIRLFASPGYSTESWQVFRAWNISPVPVAERLAREAEEAEMIQWWLPFSEAVEAVLSGRIADSMTVAGILAEQARRTR